MPLRVHVRPYCATPAGQPPAILVVGDSIAHGEEPIPGTPPATWDYVCHAGWRAYVYQELARRGLTPTMMGGLANAVDGLAFEVAGNAHNGNNGASTENWITSYWSIYKAANWDGQGTPTIVGLATGANDANTTEAGARIGDLIDLAAATYPRANLLVQTRIPRLDVGADAAINDEIRAQVATRKARGYHVDLVDAYARFPASRAYLPDDVHPNAAGYRILGDVWNAAIARCLP